MATIQRTRRARRAKAHINVVPYIDVMLVLLVIFMVAAPVVNPGLVNLPTVANATPQQTQPPIVVTIKGDGTILARIKTSSGATEQKLANNNELRAFVKQRTDENPDQPVVIAADKAVKAEAIWWLLNRKDNDWQAHGLANALKTRGIYDPDKLTLTSITVPEPPKESKLPPLAEIAKLKGDAKRGAQIATACYTCHRIGSEGVEYAPNLTGWAARQPLEVVLRSIADPSADIAHGFGGHELILKDGTVIHGLLLADADPLIIMSTGAVTQTVPKNRVKEKKALPRSLMLSAEQMGLDAQALADVAAFLRTK